MLLNKDYIGIEAKLAEIYRGVPEPVMEGEEAVNKDATLLWSSMRMVASSNQRFVKRSTDDIKRVR